ncbi:MAG: hypothetical protein V1872_04800 [bacterium]
MELAQKIGILVDKLGLLFYVLTLLAITAHFFGFVKVGRFAKRFLVNKTH